MRKYVTLQQAAVVLPAKTSYCTLWRWCAKGVYIRTINEIIPLQHAYIGRKMFTTEPWLEEFIDRLTAARMTERQWRSEAAPGASCSGSWTSARPTSSCVRPVSELPEPGDELRQLARPTAPGTGESIYSFVESSPARGGRLGVMARDPGIRALA